MPEHSKRYLPITRSPFVQPGEQELEELHHKPHTSEKDHHEASHHNTRSYLPITRSPFVQPQDQQTKRLRQEDQKFAPYHSSENDNSTTRSRYGSVVKPDPNARPEFRRFTQASDLELFYDLFFVANLTVFTYVHDINDYGSLKQYIGFFAILWFSWYQVSLYDVRFSMDSVFERACKALHLLAMIGFAICGPEFKVGHKASDVEAPDMEYFQGLTIVLVISRLVLVCQYLQTLWFARDYKKSIVPISLISFAYFVAAMIYLGLFWTFRHVNEQGGNRSYVIWYVVSVSETILVTVVSIVWRNLSFEGTHLVERMSLLTLIILGEGAISTAKACQYITSSRGAFTFTGYVAAEIFCAVLNLYFLYMIYFDWVDEEHFGVIRTQIWSAMHFPFHLGLVLAVEGASNCITWTAGVRRSHDLSNTVTHWQQTLFGANSSTMTASNFAQAAQAMNTTATMLLERQLETTKSSLSTVQGMGYSFQIRNAALPTLANGMANPTAAHSALLWMNGVLSTTIFKIGGFYTPETADQDEKAMQYMSTLLNFSAHDIQYWNATALEDIHRPVSVFGITYTYFFIATGFVLVLFTLLAWLNRGRYAKAVWYRLLVTALIGMALIFLSMMVLTKDVSYFVLGPWLLPTITFCLFAIVLLNSVKLPELHLRQRSRRE